RRSGTVCRRRAASPSRAALIGRARELVAPATARADDAKGGLGFLLYNLQLLVPNDVGADVATISGGARRFRLSWSDQAPLGIFGGDWDASDPETARPLMRHRIVLDVGLSLVKQTLPGGDNVEHTTVDGRFGYRFRSFHAGAVAFLAGVGTTIEGT